MKWLLETFVDFCKKQRVNKEVIANWKLWFEAVRLEETGETVKAAALYTKVGGPWNEFYAAFHTGDPEKAAAALEKLEGVEFGERLSLYLAATSAGKPSIAKAQFDKALAILREGTSEWRGVARMLTAGRAPASEEALAIALWPTNKRLVLAALGTVHPELRKPCFALARKLNYAPGYLRLFLEKYLNTPPPSVVPFGSALPPSNRPTSPRYNRVILRSSASDWGDKTPW
ncbi:hypothetical protein ACFL01_00265 [Planctomycetota bacterium]